MPGKRAITAEDLYRFELINHARISPDGTQVIFTRSRVEKKTEKKYSNLWLVSTEGQARQYTWGDHNDSTPRWSPDGKKIAFLSNRLNKEKPSRLFIIPSDGGEAYPLTEIDGEIGSLSWSPDGKKLLCKVRKTDPDVLEREQDEQKKKLGTVYRKYERVFYKLDGYGYLPHERWHLWTVDAKTGKAVQITDSPKYDENDPAWSPDGKWIAYASNHSEDPDFTPDRNEIFLQAVSGGEIKTLPAPYGDKYLLSFSPDGKWLAYFGFEGEDLHYKNQGVWIVPVDGSKPAKNITANFDFHVSAWTINDMGEPEFIPPTWSCDSQTIYFQVAEHGRTLLKSIKIDGSDIKDVINEPGVVGSFSWNADQTKMAYLFGDLYDPCQVYLYEANTKTKHCLTDINSSLLKNIKLGEVQEVWFKGPDENDLQGWVIKPPDFDPNKQYPAIIEIHGGPMTQYGFFFMHEFNYFTSRGFVVCFCNPRGGRGYGEEHTKAIWKDWGSKDYQDIMAWTDKVETLPFVDKSKIGVTGGSYGGYMTVWLIGHTQRYQAAVTQRCVSNLISMWGSSDFNWAFQVELANGTPFEDLNTYWDQSPIKYIGTATTPTLVIHNENDMRCPIEQGEQVFVALKKLGVETAFVRFPDEFHGMSRTGRTDRKIARLNHIIGWFEKYLK